MLETYIFIHTYHILIDVLVLIMFVGIIFQWTLIKKTLINISKKKNLGNVH